MINLLERRSDLLVRHIDVLRDEVRRTVAGAAVCYREHRGQTPLTGNSGCVIATQKRTDVPGVFLLVLRASSTVHSSAQYAARTNTYGNSGNSSYPEASSFQSRKDMICPTWSAVAR
jgi:hypothetical protein